MRPNLQVNLCAVVLSVGQGEPVCAVLDENATGFLPRLPEVLLDIDGDRTLAGALRSQLRAQLGFEVGYVEQLYTFGDRDRNPRTTHGWPRVLTIAYLALVSGAPALQSGARWTRVYDHLPWEDRRDGHLDAILASQALRATDAEERGLFGTNAAWDEYRALERYEQLFAHALVSEAGDGAQRLGLPLDLDHRRIVATAMTRIRGKIRFRPIVFDLLPAQFTLFQLQQVVEALAGVRVHKQNFRRILDRAGLVQATGETDRSTGGRPAAMYRLHPEHPAVGVGIPRATP